MIFAGNHSLFMQRGELVTPSICFCSLLTPNNLLTPIASWVCFHDFCRKLFASRATRASFAKYLLIVFSSYRTQRLEYNRPSASRRRPGGCVFGFFAHSFCSGCTAIHCLFVLFPLVIVRSDCYFRGSSWVAAQVQVEGDSAGASCWLLHHHSATRHFFNKSRLYRDSLVLCFISSGDDCMFQSYCVWGLSSGLPKRKSKDTQRCLFWSFWPRGWLTW